ncbi:glycosyltransferase family 2 protein [Thiothrix winogradskyi]|uniref:Glycosyltransferase family 2 protein n=1 Tax=Thiothrix winogradskyi TaxID=96472 RepID=A0ABY3T3R7_9GAMM|nr:glycosyltransferase family 2 protein [Thiothrix winogradskyi]UJS25917.1 glycosyltransferase family 2 protein [Thiothrix winogradskyi]
MNRSAIPTVAILLCTYNGQRYLSEQLDSVATQTYPHWRMWVSDDGSQDDTPSILTEYRSKWFDGRLSIVQGPRQGFVANFLSLSCREEIQAEYYAFCDQDDVWEADKLQRALDCLQAVPADIPALYGSRTRLVDANNGELGLSAPFTRSPGFAHALTQNIACGNTMVFNHAAIALLRDAGSKVAVVAHDWWLYLLVSGAGGQVFYDAYPGVRYRQHNSNLVGMKTHWLARLVRLRTIREVWRGTFRAGNERQMQALQVMRAKLSPANRVILDRFMLARNRWLLPRLLGFWQSGIYREPLGSHLGLIAAAILKKI